MKLIKTRLYLLLFSIIALSSGMVAFSNTAQSTPVISSITVANGKVYQRDVLQVGKTVYIDRAYTFTLIPSAMVGGDFIRSYNVDRTATGNSFITFTLARDATVYVAYDSRRMTVPSWLSTWTNTGQALVTTDFNNTTLSRRIYSRTFAAGTVTLGGNAATTSSVMYIAIVVPNAITPTPTTPTPTTPPPGTAPALSIAPAELVFSGVKGQLSTPQTITLSNTGSAPLSISAFSIAGSHPTAFSVVNAPALPLSVPEGQTIALSVRFNPPSTMTGALSGLLRLTTNLPGQTTVDFPLYGLSMNGLEGGNEPPLDWVVRTLGHAINVGGTGLILGTNPNPIGDEVRASLFQRATSGPVTLRPVARYSPNELLPFGYFVPVDGGAPVLNQTASINTGQHQTLNPAIVPGGSLTFDPGSATFGIYVSSLTFRRNSYSLSSLNTGVPHATRIYPLKNRAGTLIPNSYLVCFEDASNGDYQDYVFVLSNVVLATASVTPTATPTTTPTATSTITPTATPTPTQPAGEAALYRINAGSTTALTTSDGKTWSPDSLFVGGRTSFQNGQIINTVDDVLYHTSRSATTDLSGFGYAFPAQAGTYTVRMHFAENWFVGGGRGPTGVGRRVFDVLIENTLVLDNYDITAAVGILTPDVRTFNNVVVSDGTLNINFTASANRPLVSAIEIILVAAAPDTAGGDPFVPTEQPTLPPTTVPTEQPTELSNLPPMPNAGADVVLVATAADALVEFTLDGRGSVDPDGHLAVYSWRELDVEIGTTPTLTLQRGVGTYTFTLIVVDNAGAVALDTVQITIAAPGG